MFYLSARSEIECMLWMLQVQREAIQAVEQDGIVFIDEIDKIVVNQDLRYGGLPHADIHCMLHHVMTHSQCQLMLCRMHMHQGSTAPSDLAKS